MSEYLGSNEAVAAHFEYDAFGRGIVATGSVAEFKVRFSTKREDMETGLNYYGYRYYDPLTGRWLSRDPKQEDGGVNIYDFVANSSVSWFDRLGLEPMRNDVDEHGYNRSQEARNKTKDSHNEVGGTPIFTGESIAV